MTDIELAKKIVKLTYEIGAVTYKPVLPDLKLYENGDSQRAKFLALAQNNINLYFDGAYNFGQFKKYALTLVYNLTHNLI